MPDVFRDTVLYRLASFFSRDIQVSKCLPDAVLGNTKVCGNPLDLCGIGKISDMLLQSIVVKSVGTPGSRLFRGERVFSIQPFIDALPRDTKPS